MNTPSPNALALAEEIRNFVLRPEKDELARLIDERVGPMRNALEATRDKLERVSAAAYGTTGHSEHTQVVLHQARAALGGWRPSP